MKKLSQPMIDMLIDARSNANQLRGKTNTMVALMDRNLAYLWVNRDGGSNQVRLTAEGVEVADTYMPVTEITDDEMNRLTEIMSEVMANMVEVPTEVTEVTEVTLTVHQAYAMMSAGQEFVILPSEELRNLATQGLVAERDTGVLVTWHTTDLGKLVGDHVITLFEYGIDYPVTVPVAPGALLDYAATMRANIANLPPVADADEVGTDTVPIPTRSVTDTQRQVDVDHARGRQERGRRRKATRRAVRAHAKARRRRTR